MKIYTTTGDRGRTGLFSGERVSKTDARVEAYGQLDELNSLLGLLVSAVSGVDLGGGYGRLGSELQGIQSRLFCLGSWLATGSDSAAMEELPGMGPQAVAELETAIDDMEGELVPLRGFILPGGHALASQAHLARAVCRRVERRVVVLLDDPGAEPWNERLALTVKYLNRLSDYLFVLARVCNHRQGVADTPWQPR